MASITSDEENGASDPSCSSIRRSPNVILAGARDEAEYQEFPEDWVAPFEDLDRVITPSHGAWLRAARILARLVAGHDRKLDQLLVAFTGRGISLPDLEASVAQKYAQELGFDDVRAARGRGMANVRRPGGGTPIPFCQ